MTILCLSSHDGQVYVLTSSVFAVFGSLANLLTIFLIVWTRAYRQHVHRLTLYLAILGLCFSVALGLDVIPADIDAGNSYVVVRSGWHWDDVCTAIGFVIEHLAFSRSLASLTVCFYIFMLAVFEVKLNRTVHEVSGVAMILFLPALLSWIPFVHRTYGLAGVWCWMKVDCSNSNNSSESLFSKDVEIGMVALDIVPNVASLVLICAVGVVFGRRARTIRMPEYMYLRKQHWLALKEVFPLSLYPFCLGVAILELEITRILTLDTTYWLVSVCLLQTVPLILPLSLLSHSSIRRSCVSRFKAANGHAVSVQGEEEEEEEGPAGSQDNIHVHSESPRRVPTETDSLIGHPSV